MSFKNFSILFWAITIIMCAAVYIQKDESAKFDAIRWLIFAASVYLIAGIMQIVSKKK